MARYIRLMLKGFEPYILDELVKTGTTVRSLKYTEFQLQPYPLPPIDEQQRIFETVDRLMDECDALEEQQEREHSLQVQVGTAATEALQSADDAEALRPAWERVREHLDTVTATPEGVKALDEATLQLAIRGKLTSRKPDDTPAARVLKGVAKRKRKWFKSEKEEGNKEANLQKRKFESQDIEYPPSDKLPENWKWATLLESALVVVDCHNKTAPYVDSGIPLVRTSNIRDGEVHLDELKYVTHETYEKWSRRCPPEPGDILFTREAPIGEAGIIPSGVQLCMGQRMMLIRPIQGLVRREYLLTVLIAPGLLERSPIEQKGSTVKHLRVGDVESLIIPIPPLEEQRRIVETVKRLRSLTQDLKDSVSKVKTIGQQLVQNSLSVGETHGGALEYASGQV